MSWKEGKASRTLDGIDEFLRGRWVSDGQRDEGASRAGARLESEAEDCDEGWDQVWIENLARRMSARTNSNGISDSRCRRRGLDQRRARRLTEMLEVRCRPNPMPPTSRENST